ncbi:MAG: oligoendopeptidase F [Elusimicrobiales bacterium]|nr:oligoendopeptidase F [Elusimicrobiales bacterium]
MKKLLNTIVLIFAAFACLSGLSPSRAGAQAVKQRSEIDAKYKWDLSSIFPDDAAWQKSLEQVKAGLGGFEQYRGKLSSSAANVREALKLSDSLSVIAGNLSVYAGLKLDEDNRASKYQEMQSQASDLYSKLSKASSFIQPELLAMDSATLMGYAASDPGLKAYTFMLTDLVRSKAHILSDKEEALLSGAGPVLDAPSRIFNMIDDADISFGSIKDENGKDVQLTRERYSTILDGPDRRMRRDASELYNGTYLKYINGMAATLSSSVKKDYFLSVSRKYPGCLEASLDGDNIPVSVFKSLIAAAGANLAPLHKWTALRKKILGVDTLYTYDLSATLMKEKPKEYAWEEARAMVLAGLSPLGKTYLDDFSKGLDGGWIDVYETQGKGSGGYAWGTYTSHPYILLNYNGSLDHVSTLAHEMGHSMNNLWTNRNEPYQYSGHSLFTAEVASTCNEAILMKYMIANAKDKREKEYLLMKYIEQIVGTFYTQVMFSEFELAIHERVEKGGSLSVDFFRKTYRGIYQKYWGPDLVIGPNNDLGGMRISHFYREYYVYQYATSYAAAQVLSDKIVRKEPGALEAYYRFLRTGSSDYPVEVLKKAGVDMTTPEPVARTIKLFGELVDQLDQLLNEKV